MLLRRRAVKGREPKNIIGLNILTTFFVCDKDILKYVQKAATGMHDCICFNLRASSLPSFTTHCSRKFQLR